MADYLIKGETLTGIADSIREKTGKTEQIKAEDMAAGVGEVFESGKKSEYDAFWDNFQKNGDTLMSYGYAFACSDIWTQENIEKIKYKTFKANYFAVAFSGNTSVTDLSMFKLANRYSQWDDYAPLSWSNTFGGCTNLVKCMEINFDMVSSLPNVFNKCESLEDLPVTGTLKVNGLNLQWSTKLKHECLVAILNALQDKSGDTSGTAWVVTIGEVNRAKLTEEELAIAIEKGWEVA